jgi:leader peptidase (prepilin peptidase)/N-methyltransferase
MLVTAVLAAALAVATVTDLRARRIPDAVTAPAALAALALQPGHLPWGLAAGGFLLAGALLHPGGMGLGDVKLAVVMGVCLGSAVVLALIAALVLGTLAGVGIAARRGVAAARAATLPFAPCLAGGALAALLAS